MSKVFKMIISQEGFDVKTCTPDQLIMSSDFNMLKTALTGTITGAGVVGHNLPYVPIFFVSDLVGGKQSIIGDDYQTTCDSTNLNIAGGTYRYYLFYQQGIA